MWHFIVISENNSDTSRLNNVYIINLPHCKDVTVKKEINGAENQEPQSINLQRVGPIQIFTFLMKFNDQNLQLLYISLQLSNRVRNQVEEKKRLVSALKANASEDAQNLYMFLAKMLNGHQGTGHQGTVYMPNVYRDT